ncbi:hypothetical protein KY362_03695 [Candidatus Woesearchaeota archaeon]|nr:hypothetical protein [Candidatus Woesearchaeota archaeon]
MKESTLLRIALVVSIIGIGGLFLMLRGVEVDEAIIGKLDEHVEEDVVVTGVVMGVTELDGVTFVLLQKDETVSITLFGRTPDIETGDLIQVRGTVSKEGDELEIMGEEVRVV